MKENTHDPSYQDEEEPPPKLGYIWKNIILMALLHVVALYGIILIPSCKNDVYEWARDHCAHHKFTETHADPHNSRRGFFFSHVGWLLVRKHPAVKKKGGKLDMSDLEADKPVMFQRRYYEPGLLLMCFLLPTLVPWYCWGEIFLHSFYVAALLSYALVLSAIWLAKSAAHLCGHRPHNTGAQETVPTSVGAQGEGFHNFPYDYSASEYRWHVNFTTFFIDRMAALGLTYDWNSVQGQDQKHWRWELQE
ncbi:hypothetical protein U0070_013581 [Myodes glareolus]|uniref:Fatty acid desaturase domain-containing protein n=1 Tax=Myodes glareolus TaxID=447135 RepID=A0AAW0I9H3_MYOGA